MEGQVASETLCTGEGTDVHAQTRRQQLCNLESTSGTHFPDVPDRDGGCCMLGDKDIR